jgi:hypothetical protein
LKYKLECSWFATFHALSYITKKRKVFSKKNPFVGEFVRYRNLLVANLLLTNSRTLSTHATHAAHESRYFRYSRYSTYSRTSRYSTYSRVSRYSSTYLTSCVCVCVCVCVYNQFVCVCVCVCVCNQFVYMYISYIHTYICNQFVGDRQIQAQLLLGVSVGWRAADKWHRWGSPQTPRRLLCSS